MKIEYENRMKLMPREHRLFKTSDIFAEQLSDFDKKKT